MSLIGTILGLLILSALSIYAVYFAYRLVTTPDALLGLMKLGLGLALVLLVWAFAFDPSPRK
jgi:hypothetical protein